MKRLLCCIISGVLMIFMVGCNGDSDIVGFWEQEMEISILGSADQSSAASVCQFTFREDGTGLQNQIILDGSYPDAVREFAYRIEGDRLTIDYGENQTEEFTFILAKDSLKLENRRGSFDLKRVP